MFRSLALRVPTQNSIRAIFQCGMLCYVRSFNLFAINLHVYLVWHRFLAMYIIIKWYAVNTEHTCQTHKRNYSQNVNSTFDTGMAIGNSYFIEISILSQLEFNWLAFCVFLWMLFFSLNCQPEIELTFASVHTNSVWLWRNNSFISLHECVGAKRLPATHTTNASVLNARFSLSSAVRISLSNY